jgi:hypothetical protein
MSRGSPLPWPIALVLTVVGAALIVLGFTVIPAIPEMDGGFGNAVMVFIAGLIIVPTLLIALLVVLRGTKRRRADDEAVAAVPQELPEPPTRDDAALVATVVGDGTASRRAVAGTILELAERGALDVEEYGPKLVISVSPRAAGATPEEALVLGSLRELADENGAVTGPPIWHGKVAWWRDFARGARTRALDAGLVQTRLPFVGLILFTVMIATAVAILFFWRTAVFVGCIVLANGFPHLVARASGFRLTTKGKVERAQWLAFGRHLGAHRSVRDVGPAAVAMWGPNLVYGVVLGEAPRAARPLTPEGDDDTEDPATLTQVYEL